MCDFEHAARFSTSILLIEINLCNGTGHTTRYLYKNQACDEIYVLLILDIHVKKKVIP